MYIELILNLSLLVAISVVSGFIVQRWPRDSRSGAIFQGILFGGAAVFGMLQPLVLGPGLIFDGRSVMLSICTLFFGPWAAIPSVLMSAGYRIWIGGVGVHMGVLVILASAGIGLIGYFRWRAREIPPSTLMLYVLGLAVHVVMLGLLFTLPDNIAVPALGHIGLPVILLYPLATILAGKILSDQQESFNYMKKLQASERKYGAMVETLPLAIILSSGTEEIIEYINPTMVKLFGYSKEDIPDVGKWWPLAYPDETYRSQISGKWTKRVKRAIETQSPVEPMETVVTCKDGAKKNVLWGFITIGEKNYSYGLDLTERKTAESHRDRQLYFAKALNGIAEVIIFKDNPDDILESVNRIIGETLQVDRTLIYDISFEQNYIIGLCEWLRSNHPNIAPTKDRYPLELFINSFTEIRKTRKYLESHFNEVNEHFIADGSGKILHEQMNIKSLIWYPFAFDEHGYYVFTLNQILERRQWT
ncbi:MAG: LytS/YhcK type 5TM receptor domain-containing protein, partial [Desulfuromonadales bacterium]